MRCTCTSEPTIEVKLHATGSCQYPSKEGMRHFPQKHIKHTLEREASWSCPWNKFCRIVSTHKFLASGKNGVSLLLFLCHLLLCHHRSSGKWPVCPADWPADFTQSHHSQQKSDPRMPHSFWHSKQGFYTSLCSRSNHVLAPGCPKEQFFGKTYTENVYPDTGDAFRSVIVLGLASW